MNEKKERIIHPFEVFDISQLADRLGVSYNTIKNMMGGGLQYKKFNSLTFFTGQQVLNYFNQETKQYTQEQVDKVFRATGVKLAK